MLLVHLRRLSSGADIPGTPVEQLHQWRQMLFNERLRSNLPAAAAAAAAVAATYKSSISGTLTPDSTAPYSA
jgi:hypothetical protein